MFIVLLCLLDHQINNFNSMIYQFLIMLHFTCIVHFFIFNDHFVIMSVTGLSRIPTVHFVCKKSHITCEMPLFVWAHTEPEAESYPVFLTVVLGFVEPAKACFRFEQM